MSKKQGLFSRRNVRRARRAIGGFAMRWMGPPLVRALSRTWKVELIGGEFFERMARPRGDGASGASPGCMAAIWHGRMLLGVEFGRARNFAVLVSPSADGEISMRLLRAFGYRVVRGSASRGGARAVREMLGELRAGSVVVITPDGPRGPRHSVNPGLAWMARATGHPIVPIGLATNRAWRLSSWDDFTIPKPFARVTLVFGEPLRVEREAGQEAIASTTERLRESLIECERRGFAHLGAREDW